MDIAIKYSPILLFHQNEKYFPVTIHDYIINSELLKDNNVIATNITDPNEITSSLYDPLLSQTDQFQTQFCLRLKYKPDKGIIRGCEWYIKNNNTNKTVLTRTPVYYTFIYTGHHDSIGEFIDIVYVITYCYNGTLLSHSYDSENITIRFNKKDGDIKPSKVALSTHEGHCWYDYSDFTRTAEYKINVHVAKSSHAMYPNPRTRKRIFGFGNDHVSTDNWMCSFECVFPGNSISELKPEYKYMGFTGKRSPDLEERFVPAQRHKLDILDYTPPIHSVEYIRHHIDISIWIVLFSIGIILAGGFIKGTIIMITSLCILFFITLNE
jgi:hypothetical protein